MQDTGESGDFMLQSLTRLFVKPALCVAFMSLALVGPSQGAHASWGPCKYQDQHQGYNHTYDIYGQSSTGYYQDWYKDTATYSQYLGNTYCFYY